MRFVTAALAAASLAASAVAAVAAPVQLSDAQFLAANRCLGILTSHKLGTPDAAAMRRLLDGQPGRASYIYDKADDMRRSARAEANHAGPAEAAQLAAERDGLCHSFIATTTTATSASRGAASSIR